MPLPPLSHNLFERTWRSTCPIRPRHSRLRRWTGLGLLTVLCGMIVGYALITDSDRVRHQAEEYLSRLLGGPAEVQAARLSLFEGLRLEGVTIRTPPPEGAGEAEGAIFFTARSLHIDYSPLELLLGKISATKIVAVDPHVRLTEDVDAGVWNFQQLRRRPGAPERPSRFRAPDELPEILLRNAQVEVARLSGGELSPRGSVGIEAQLRPQRRQDDPARGPGQSSSYLFSLQTRGLAGAAGAGPRASGIVDLHEGQVEARLDDIEFGALLDILPRAAAEWWRQHDIRGRLDVPSIWLDWDDLVSVTAPDGSRELVPRFRARVDLSDANMQGLPEEWLPADEIAFRRWTGAQLEKALAATTSETARRVLTQMVEQTSLKPLRLRDVSGSFHFNEKAVRVTGLVGDFEGNRLRLDGIVSGYGPDAAISLVVQNGDDVLSLPPNLPYVSSLPRQVREVYERFLPNGQCRLRLELHRPGPGPDGTRPRPIVTGHVDVLGGTFTLDRFPYPVRNARGRLLLRYDRETQQDQLVIDNLRGGGLAGGPNEDATITVHGEVGPLTNHAGFDITVTGRNVRDEPALIASLPREAREAVANFDPAHHGRGPPAVDGTSAIMSFGGDFRARVLRPPGPRQRWDFRVDLALREMNGAFFAFPYPLQDARATVSVFPDHVEIVDARTTRPHPDADGQTPAATDVRFKGRVDWGLRPGDPADLSQRPIRVDLDVTATNVPTDAALLGALPPESVKQLAALGVGGVADVRARVFTDDQDELSWDVELDMREGRFWPETGTFNLADARGGVRVLPDRVELTNFVGRRGEGTVKVDGSVGFKDGGLTDVVVEAKGITLDAAIYDLLPPAAKEAWNWLHPAGETDARITYHGPTSLLLGDTAENTLAGRTEPEPDYEIILNPLGARATAEAFPYALQNVTGTIRIVPGIIELKDIRGEHPLEGDLPPAKLAMSGTGHLGAAEGGGDLWRLTPQLQGAAVDEALLAAVPEGLRETLASLRAGGRYSADFSVLQIATSPPTDAADAPGHEAPAESAAPDVTFDVKLATDDGSLDVGVPLTNVGGSLTLAGTYTRGEIHALAGTFGLERFSVRGRSGSQLQGSIVLEAGERTIGIRNISAQLADGQVAGNVELELGRTPEERTRYSAEIAVREADVRRLVGEQPGRSADFSGRMTARLDVEGAFGDANSRRGRGEVIVEGEKLYDLPLVLGLLQVTNLALPISQPFRQATAAFSVDGQRVVFDRIALRAGEMQMLGQGTLNFETQKVDMSFTTTSSGWAAIPLVGDLVGMARNELLRIHVRGTLKSPEVSGSTLPTVTSTIDEVFRRD